MRGGDAQTEKLFCYVSPDSYVPKDHPLRPVKKMVDRALRELYPEFTKMYSIRGGLQLLLRSFYGRFCCRRCIPSEACGC